MDILNFGTAWSWVFSFTPRPLYSRGKQNPYSLNSRLSSHQIRTDFFYFWGVGWDLLHLVTIWFIVPAPDDGWWWVWSSRWNDWQGKAKYWKETCLSAPVSTKNLTWLHLSSNPGLHCEKPATNYCTRPVLMLQREEKLVSPIWNRTPTPR
jgi:hypothetical protein